VGSRDFIGNSNFKNITMRKWIWQTGFGVVKEFSELDHQHLSNILWFREVFDNNNRDNSDVQMELTRELQRRFEGVRLPWKPLPIPNEIRCLNEMGLIRENGDIIGNAGTLQRRGTVIGSVAHIKNYYA
jgi:hypothetical protein